MMYPTAEERVAAGAALLDEKYGPDWRDKVDLGKLNTRSCEDCVLGQVYGEYSEGCVTLHLWSDDTPDHEQPAMLGFAINTDTLDRDLTPDGIRWGYSTNPMFERLDTQWRLLLS